MSMKITAPFTPEQVEALNRWQVAGYVHPFTCPRRSDPGHREVNGDHGGLRATEDGWVCDGDGCDYTQKWAHAIMAEPIPERPW